MFLFLTTCVLLSTCLLLGNVCAISPYPVGYKKACSFSYSDAFGFGRINPTHNWICQDSQYIKPYPKVAVDDLLQLDQYYDFKEDLSITRSCHDFVTDQAMMMTGDNKYYKWEGMCKMVRTPVKMIWAKPDTATVPQQFMGLNNGYLPVHVMDGQFLYNVECIHPWSDNPKVSDRRLARRLKRVRWTPNKRRLCLYGYMYNNKYVCKPTGYMTRYVLVYSPDMHIIFKARVDDVPTSCMCATCDCVGASPATIV